MDEGACDQQIKIALVDRNKILKILVGFWIKDIEYISTERAYSQAMQYIDVDYLTRKYVPLNFWKFQSDKISILNLNMSFLKHGMIFSIAFKRKSDEESSHLSMSFSEKKRSFYG